MRVVELVGLGLLGVLLWGGGGCFVWFVLWVGWCFWLVDGLVLWVGICCCFVCVCIQKEKTRGGFFDRVFFRLSVKCISQALGSITLSKVSVCQIWTCGC